MIIRVIRVMKIVVLADDNLKEELLNNVEAVNKEIVWIEDISQLEQYKTADAFIDLLFDKDHTETLQLLFQNLVIINSVEYSLPETNLSFIRINGWPTFLKSNLIEASASNDEQKKKAEEVFSLFNKKLEWLPDEPGFVTPRIISMIINEAFISLSEGVSTKQEIDTAMKLGTNYPYGPFEWSEKIGIKKIQGLLKKLSAGEFSYTPFFP